MTKTRLVTLPLAAGLAMLAGCASSTGSGTTTRPQGVSPALVYASDDLARWEYERGVPDATRFEFARNDQALGSRPVVALRATDQWPQALQPIERPVVFRLFQQDRSSFRAGSSASSSRGYEGRYNSDP